MGKPTGVARITEWTGTAKTGCVVECTLGSIGGRPIPNGRVAIKIVLGNLIEIKDNNHRFKAHDTWLEQELDVTLTRTPRRVSGHIIFKGFGKDSWD